MTEPDPTAGIHLRCVDAMGTAVEGAVFGDLAPDRGLVCLWNGHTHHLPEKLGGIGAERLQAGQRGDARPGLAGQAVTAAALFLPMVLALKGDRRRHRERGGGIVRALCLVERDKE